MPIYFPDPLILAHRGASALAPENTLAAFDLALKLGAPAIELDAKLTADRQVVVLHDQTLNRTTNGSGPVTQQPLAALRELDAGSWFSADFRGERIPTLAEVFEAVGKKLIINIELTNYATPFDGLIQLVAALVNQHGLQEQILFSSFYPTNLVLAKRLLPTVPRGQLILEGNPGWWQRGAASWMALEAEHPASADVTEKSVKRAHAKNRRVYTWTVNEPAELRRLRSMGVDGIFTDNPTCALENFK